MEGTSGAWTAVGAQTALFANGLGSTGLYHADVSGWPTAEVTELFPVDPATYSRWVLAEDASQAIRLSNGPADPDFQYDAQLVSIVDGVPQPTVDIDLPPASIHDVFLTPDGAFAFITTVYQAGLDELQVAWLEGPDPGTPQAIGTVPYVFVGQPDPIVLLDGWAVWTAGVGGLQATSIEGDTLGSAEQISPIGEAVQSMDVVGQRIFYTIADPTGAHVPEALWMIDLSGTEASEPISVAPPQPEGVTANYGYATPLGEQLFYNTFQAGGFGEPSTRTMWSRQPEMPGSELMIFQSTDSWGFRIVSPPQP